MEKNDKVLYSIAKRKIMIPMYLYSLENFPGEGISEEFQRLVPRREIEE